MEHQTQPLSEVVDVRTGYVRSKPEADPEGRYAVIEPGDIGGDGEIRYDGLTRTSDVAPSERHFISEGDILFIPRGVANTAALIDRPLRNTTVSSRLYVLRPSDELTPGYLAWYINQRRAQTYFKNLARGATIRSINQEILGRLSVPMPPAERQQQIARVALLARREADLSGQLRKKRDEYVQNLLIQAAT